MVLKPTAAGLQRAAKMLRSGGVVAFPTDTVYGLGASFDDELAQKRVYQIKGRPVGIPLILMVAAESQLDGLVHVDTQAQAFMRKWWPGPLMTTSANLHGREPAMSAEEAAALSGVMAVVDGGAAPGGMASTVLDLTGPEPHVLREGEITTPELLGPPPPRVG